LGQRHILLLPTPHCRGLLCSTVIKLLCIALCLLPPQIHTPDSSRYWLADSYESRLAAGQEPQNIDKEFLRLWFRACCDPYKDKVRARSRVVFIRWGVTRCMLAVSQGVVAGLLANLLVVVMCEHEWHVLVVFLTS
jgi:hypothetical protein